jgi:hypothetical protein
MFEQENQFFEENKDNLRRQYLGKEREFVEKLNKLCVEEIR